MTVFEAIMCLAATATVIILAFGMRVIIRLQQETDSNLRKMDAGLDKRLETLETLSGVIEKKLVAIVNYTYDTKLSARELTDIVDKMHRNLCVEIADKMVDNIYRQPTSVNGTPCYAPDGICTNPFRDCINCPKIGGGGTWSTNINKKND